MTKKVLISLDDFTKILKCEGRTFYDGCGDPDLEHLKNFKQWFDATLKKQNGKIAINVDGEPIIWGQNEKSTD